MTTSSRDAPLRARRFVDLHTHTTASDGCLSPEGLIALADRERLAAIAVTDHDTLDGLPAARAAAEGYPELTFVPGVEVSARHAAAALHILGLGIDEEAASLRGLLDGMRQARRERNPKILAKLRRLGFEIDMDDVLAVVRDVAGGDGDHVVGRMHIAEALRRKGYVTSTDEAFKKHIGDGRPAYVDKERVRPAAVADAVHGAGGLAALAHPGQVPYDNRAQLERIVRGLVRDGIDALEVYHSDHTDSQARSYLDLARRLDLAVVGGSDYHGAAKPGARLGRPRVPLSVVGGALGQKLRQAPRDE